MFYWSFDTFFYIIRKYRNYYNVFLYESTKKYMKAISKFAASVLLLLFAL